MEDLTELQTVRSLSKIGPVTSTEKRLCLCREMLPNYQYYNPRGSHSPRSKSLFTELITGQNVLGSSDKCKDFLRSNFLWEDSASTRTLILELELC